MQSVIMKAINGFHIWILLQTDLYLGQRRFVKYVQQMSEPPRNDYLHSCLIEEQVAPIRSQILF